MRSTRLSVGRRPVPTGYAAIRASGADPAARIALARFFAENLAVQAGALERTVIDGADSIADAAVLARA